MKFEVYRGKDGMWYWRLKSVNGQIVAVGGEGYVNKTDCLHGIALVKGTNANTPVNEV